MASGASQDRRILARHRSGRLDCGARSWPRRAMLLRRLQVHRRIFTAEAAERPEDFVSEPAHQSRSAASSVILFSDNTAGQFADCRHGHGAYAATWTENIVSGISRDLLFEAMQRIEAAGYPIVFHCHDEIIAEVPAGSAVPKNSPVS